MFYREKTNLSLICILILSSSALACRAATSLFTEKNQRVETPQVLVEQVTTPLLPQTSVTKVQIDTPESSITPSVTGELPTVLQMPSPCLQNSDMILYSSDLPSTETNTNFEVFMINPDGSSPFQITDVIGYDGFVRWSPERCRVAFSSSRDLNDEIYLSMADGSGAYRLTNDPAPDKMPDWSPDGTRIAFVSWRTGERDIFISNIDGSELFQLTDHPAEDQWLDWSPNSERIAIASRRDENWEIYLVNSDGSGLVNLTNHPMQDTHPAWSPDGERLAFITNRTSTVEIFLMNSDGTGVTQVTNFGNSTMSIEGGVGLSWSPDGKKLVFVGLYCDEPCTRGITDLFSINTDGSELMNITNDLANEHFPNWK